METHQFIADLTLNERFSGFYLLQAAELRTTAGGKPFLNAVIADRSGAIVAKVWDYSGPVREGDAGAVVWVSGIAGEYRGAPQATLDRIRLAAQADPVELTALVPAAPIDAEETLRAVRARIESITDADYRGICLEMLARHHTAFFSIPAAKSVHHGFLNGLLMHTANMLRIADLLAELYADVVDRSLLLAGTFLHDFGKEEEFVLSPLGLASDYSVKGQLLGHLVMCAEEVGALGRELGVSEEKTMLLQHLILSHHGQPEFGAAVRPACVEAELLPYIDMIDSRAEICREALAQTERGKFTARIFALENRRIWNHLGETPAE